MTQKHPFHLVDPSPWPLRAATAAFRATTGGVRYRHGYNGGGFVLSFGQLRLLATRYVWWRDIVREGTFEGQHTHIVQLGLRFGRILFIVSEVRFFFAFFWAFFWGALNPPMTIATQWPPEGIEPVPTWGIPFLNTLILLLSGATVTWAHHAVKEGDQKTGFKALVITVALGVIFTGIQILEYVEQIHAGFTLQDAIFGSAFYMATGFHGLHVQIGTIFLAVCMMRCWYGTFRANKHVGFEAAAWYWHFVDVVWLFLFVWVYWCGGTISFTVTPIG